MKLMSETKRIFVAATRQNDGKTFVSLGLFNALATHFKSSSYIKPVGQEFRIVDVKNVAQKIDKDAYLFQKTYHLSQEYLPDMSPIAVPKGFTKDYLNHPNQDALKAKITSSFERLSQKHDFILIEGTGHAGVGSVFDCNNAQCAKLLNSPVILVSIGGIGKSFDEIMLNASLFKQMGINLLGVIVNKVTPEKASDTIPYIQKALERHKIPFLGYIPLNRDLLTPSIEQIILTLRPRRLETSAQTTQRIHHILVGDMVPHQALDRINDHTLVLVPGNREGLILTLLCEHLFYEKNRQMLSGFIFTDGIEPHPKIQNLLKEANLPLMLVDEDTYETSKNLQKMTFKLNDTEFEKIKSAQDMIAKAINLQPILTGIETHKLT